MKYKEIKLYEKKKYLMEQNPSRLIKEKNVLLSRLRHMQLHYLAEQHKRKKNSIKICPPCEFNGMPSL